MKKLVFVFVFLACKAGYAQYPPASNEDFVNSIFKLVADSSQAHYYLAINAAPCSFKKYDYDEWYKYGLQQDIPIYILDELAEKSFLNAAPRKWQADKLPHAVCIDEEKEKAILATPAKRHVRNQRPAFNENNIVYYFSQPGFTNDYQYAVIDIGFRCDDRQCGMGATFLFKQVNNKWVIAGKKLLWGN